MSEKASEKSEMLCELDWASDTLRNYVAPPGSAGGKLERIRKAARDLKWSFSHTKDVWYADERVSIKPRELRDIEEVSGVKYGRQEIREVSDLIANADALLEGTDPDFHSAWVAAFRAFVGAVDRTGARR